MHVCVCVMCVTTDSDSTMYRLSGHTSMRHTTAICSSNVWKPLVRIDLLMTWHGVPVSASLSVWEEE